jgi:adenylyltransferase/sulfurtransferase
MGVLQATEVLKLLLGLGEVAAGKIILYDALKLSVESVKVPRDPDCVLCGEHPTLQAWDQPETGAVPELSGGSQQAELSPADEVSVQWLQQQLHAQAALRLIDVRELHEWDLCRLPQAELHPLSVFDPEALLGSNEALVLYCHKGVRSLRALARCHEVGVRNVVSLAGGIDRWAAEIDRTMARY